jgi:hypothetical protein
MERILLSAIEYMFLMKLPEPTVFEVEVSIEKLRYLLPGIDSIQAK